MTGGSGGVGIASARVFSSVAGAKVALTSRRGADELVAEITAAGGVAKSYRADISDRTELDRAFSQIADDFGSIRSLLNISGVCEFYAPDSTPLDKTIVDDKRWERIVDVNGKGAAMAIQYASHIMSPGGSIVNVGSTAGRFGAEVAVVDYSFVKAGVVGLTMAYAKILAPLGIRVNCVAPGPIEGTAMLSAADEESLARVKSQIRLGRFCTVADIAHINLFLASEMSRALTGVTIDANGGQFICS